MSPTGSPRLRWAVLTLMVAAVVCTGCSTTTGVSASTTTGPTPTSVTAGGSSCSSVSIQMRSGSVPAPYNYEWTMTLDGDQGTLEAEGGDRGAQKWNRTFVADATSRTALCTYATELAQQDPTDGVGGSTVHAEYTPEGGSPVSGEQGVDGSAVPDRMGTALPDGVWADVQRQLDAWSNRESTSAVPTS